MGEVEVDETYIGGKEGNKPVRSRNFSSGYDGKIAVFGAKERGGRAVAKVVKSTGARALQPLVKKHILTGSKVFSDEHGSYKKLNTMGYTHESVNHSKLEYVRGKAHTNSIENMWSNFKRAITGNFHWVSRQHLQSYANEFAFREGRNDFFHSVCKNITQTAKLNYNDLIRSKSEKAGY